MITVVVRPYDDKDIVEVYLVEHNLKSLRSSEAFEKAWDEALIKTKEKNPETWCVSEVINKLERKNWQIIRCNTIVVTY